MSGGGHFNKKYWISRKLVTGRSFALRAPQESTDKSQDPLLVTRPLTEKKPGIEHERFVYKSLITAQVTLIFIRLLLFSIFLP